MDKLRYELDKEGRIGITLQEFDSLQEMDEFLKSFKDSNDVRIYYFDKINKYLKSPEAKKYMDIPAKKERNGYINCYHEFPYHKLRKVCALYDNQMISKGIYTKLGESLKNLEVLRKIYDDKFYLLPKTPSNFLRDELHRIISSNGGKTAFIRNFIAYIHNLDEEENYVYLRCLCDICDLLEKKRKATKVKLKVVNVNVIKEISEYSLVYEPKYELADGNEFKYLVYDDAPDYFKYVFNKALKDNDFEILFNEFTQEEISRYSNYYEKGKVR